MSLFGSLYTGTAGMLAQERSTSVISENIANVTTTGYKRQETAFQDMLSTNKYTTRENGSVLSTRINRIDHQGTVQQTGSKTDIAVIGNGFFSVREPGALADDRFLYTRNGTFQPNENGTLQNSAGFELYGWPIDQNGTVSSGPDTTSLQLVDVDLFATQSTPTTAGVLSINLDSQESAIDPHTLNPAQLLPVSSQAAQFARSVAVYDTGGTERRVTFEFRKIVGPMAHFSSNNNTPYQRTADLIDPNGPTPGINGGDVLQISDGVNMLDVTMVAAPANTALGEASNINEVISVINNFTDGVGAPVFTASLSEAGRLLVQSNSLTGTMDISGSSASVLGAGGFNFIADPFDGDYVYAPEADMSVDGVANPNQSAFPPLANTTTANPFHWWEVSITTIDPATPSGTATTEISKGLINFNGDGSLNATVDGSGQALIDLGTINFDSADASEDVAMVFDIADFTQYAGEYNVLIAEQNGTPLGSFVGVEVTRDGIVEALFNNGERVPSYQIPLAHFVNVNGLERISGTAFAETEDSGIVTMFEAGLGGTGTLQSSSLENSNVDLANEFSMLIVNQRAFSLNSRLISTIDEMTQLTSRLKQ